jgi:uncharacterized membrane protein
MSLTPTAGASSRIETVDWLKGLACLVMMQTHSLVLLNPTLQQGTFFGWLCRLDGLVAPAFIFSAGFALSLTLRRAQEKNQLPAQLKKSASRILQVLGMATLINTIWFQPWWRPWFLLRLDILHAIGLSLLLQLAWVAVFASRPHLLAGSLLALALCIFAVSPLLESVRGFGQLFVNTAPGFLDEKTGAMFSLFPWAGWIFLGAFLGAWPDFSKGIFFLTALGAVAWFNEDFLRLVYPPHDVWLTGPGDVGRRLTLICWLLVLGRQLETRGTKFTWLQRVGTSSLSLYFIHEMLLYQRHVGIFGKLFRGELQWLSYWAVTVGLVANTLALQSLWNRLISWAKSRRFAS